MDQLRAVLFDLDCTLIDRRQSIAAYTERFLDDFGSQLTAADHASILPVLLRADGGGYRFAQRAGDILAGLPWSQAPTAEELDAHWRRHTPVMCVPMASAVETLRACRERGLALAIVTNGTVNSQQRKLDALNLAPEVDAVVISEAAGCKKPDPRIFASALRSLDVPADQAVYVGDHPVNDVLGATAAGLRAIWLEGWHDWPDDEPSPQWVAGSLSEVVELLDSHDFVRSL